MKLIVGLGNPGTKYEQTRHNAGFLALDAYLENRQGITCQGKFQAQICELHFGPQKVFFVKPQTFMNLSGQAVGAILDFYRLDPAQDLLVVHDDVDLPLGVIKLTASSSAAGHNGVKNIIKQLGTQDFHRVRIGVETRADKKLPPTEAFVLQAFSETELQTLAKQVFPNLKLIIDKFLAN